MSEFGAERSDAATPGMLFLSVSLHLLVIFLVFMVSFSALNPSMPHQEGITRVSLIEEPATKAPIETISHGPVKMQEPEVTEAVLQKKLSTDAPEFERQIVSYETPHQKSKAVIPLKKRKASPQRIETAKPEPFKKRESKTAEKKDEQKDFLEKRLAAIRTEVEKRRKEQSVLRESRQSSGTSGPGTSKAPTVSEDFVRWFEDVRGRINSHWSLFGDNQKKEKFAVIGVRLSDDGRLIEATVDETSGDPLFDKSAMRAVFLASPFPPVPHEIREKIRQSGGLALRFSPGGMQ